MRTQAGLCFVFALAAIVLAATGHWWGAFIPAFGSGMAFGFFEAIRTIRNMSREDAA